VRHAGGAGDVAIDGGRPVEIMLDMLSLTAVCVAVESLDDIDVSDNISRYSDAGQLVQAAVRFD